MQFARGILDRRSSIRTETDRSDVCAGSSVFPLGIWGPKPGASEHASERANERARLSSTGEVVCERDNVAAAAVGLAPDVKFLCGKAQLYFTF